MRGARRSTRRFWFWRREDELGGVDDIAEQPTAPMILTYAVQMIIGAHVVTLGVRFFKERANRAALEANTAAVPEARHPA